MGTSTPAITSAQDLDALRGLLEEMLEKARAAKPVVVYRTTRTDIAAAPCKTLVQRVITERGEQAAAVFAAKLNGELARRGKTRVALHRNGNGVHVDPTS